MDRFDESGDVLGRSEVDRRKVLKAGFSLGAGAVGMAGLAACSSGGGKSFTGQGNKGGGDTAPQGNSGGIAPTPRHQTVIVDQSEFTVFDQFNPFIPNGETYQGGLGQVVKEWLWYFNMATGEIKPWLGQSYSYADDFRTFTIKLNPKAHWNDGKPFTSRDVKFTMMMIKGNSALLGGGPGTDEAASITTPDAQTVVIKLNVRDPRYHYNFICGIVSAQFPVVPEHIWSKHDPTKFANNPPVYTGPYKLQRAIPDHKMFVWEKDPNYWNKAEMDPAPKYVVYRTAPSSDADIQQFKQAQTDVGGAAGIYQLVDAAIKSGYKDAIITKMIDPCERTIYVNCDPSRGILADPRMRTVVSLLLDRKRIGTSIWPVDVPPAVYPWPAYPNNKKWEIPSVAANYDLTYDPTKAAKLLDEMGAKAGANGKRTYQGKPLSYEIITPVTTSDPEYFIAHLLAADLKKIGIDASAKTLSGSVYSERVDKGQFDMRSEWLCGEVYDPWQLYNQYNSAYYVPIGKVATKGNNIRLKNPALDHDIKKLGALNPTDPMAKPVFTTALNDWYKAMPSIPSVQTTYTHQFNTSFWKNWPTDDNLYMVPNNWWGQFLFVIGSLKPTGRT
jgi:peptide/nickel transport system substrate-binding protein